MASFTTPLELIYLDGCKWEVHQPFEYHLGVLGGPERVLIPAGFITDFASIPRMLWPVLPPTGQYGKAAVIHDWLYQHRTVEVYPSTTVMGAPLVQSNTIPTMRLVDRGEADHILLEGMQALKVGWFTRSTIYSGVRTGGWHSWNRYRSEEEHHDGLR